MVNFCHFLIFLQYQTKTTKQPEIASHIQLDFIVMQMSKGHLGMFLEEAIFHHR